MSLKIRKGDIVEVISGSEKYNPVNKRRGRVIKVLPSKGKVLVEELNKKFKHVKPSTMNPKGGRIEKEAPMPLGKVMLVCPACDKTTRVKVRFDEEGRKTRYCMRCGSDIKAGKSTG